MIFDPEASVVDGGVSSRAGNPLLSLRFIWKSGGVDLWTLKGPLSHRSTKNNLLMLFHWRKDSCCTANKCFSITDIVTYLREPEPLDGRAKVAPQSGAHWRSVDSGNVQNGRAPDIPPHC